MASGQLNAVDQSWSSLTPAAAVAKGIRLVADYLSHDPSKDWTAPQIAAYLAAGVGCMFLWETTSNRALSGYAAGVADGQSAAAELDGLIRAVGQTPSGKLGICAAVDFDTNSSTYGTVIQYLQGFRAGVAGRYLIGCYGEADLLDTVGSVVDFGFQTYAWSGGRISPTADLYQFLNGQTINGATVDYDQIINANQLGAWWPNGQVPSGVPVASGGGTVVNSDEGDAFLMAALTDGEIQDMYNVIMSLRLPGQLYNAPVGVNQPQWNGDFRGVAQDALTNIYTGPPTDLSQEAYQAGPGAPLWAQYQSNIGSQAFQTAYLNGYSSWVATNQALAKYWNLQSIGAKVEAIAEGLASALQALAAISEQIGDSDEPQTVTLDADVLAQIKAAAQVSLTFKTGTNE